MSPSATTVLSPPKRPQIRRLNSNTATHEDLAASPAIAVPEKHMGALSPAHETAAAMEFAKLHLKDPVASGMETPPITPSETEITDTYAYAFDIDGVLIRGGEVIPEAIEAMRMLNGENEYGIKV